MALDLTKFEGKLIKDGKDCDAKGAEYYGKCRLCCKFIYIYRCRSDRHMYAVDKTRSPQLAEEVNNDVFELCHERDAKQKRIHLFFTLCFQLSLLDSTVPNQVTK